MPRLVFSQLRVLIVEDERVAANFLRRMLIGFGVSGYNIEWATDGEEARTLFAVNPFDLILMDYEMRPVNGLSFAREIRWHPAFGAQPVPIILITAHTKSYVVQRARDVGINEILVKPVSREDLRQRITLSIEQPRRYIRANGFKGPDRRRQRGAFTGTDRRK